MDCNYRQDDLIYDIGAHKGDDAAFYLAKGFRVISVAARLTLHLITADLFHQWNRIHHGTKCVISPGAQ